jgi:hypothetical protein
MQRYPSVLLHPTRQIEKNPLSHNSCGLAGLSIFVSLFLYYYDKEEVLMYRIKTSFAAHCAYESRDGKLTERTRKGREGKGGLP